MVKKWFEKKSIEVITALSFTFVSILCAVIISVALFFIMDHRIENMQIDNSELVLTQVNLNLASHIKSIMNVSDTIYYHVIKNADIQEGNIAQSLELLYDENRDSIVSISLFSGNGDLISSTPYHSLKENIEITHREWFKIALERPENIHFSAPMVQHLFERSDDSYNWVVPVTQYVSLTDNGDVSDGVLRVDMNFNGISQLLGQVRLGNQGYVYLIDKDGELIYHPKQHLIYSGIQEENNVQASTYSDGTVFETFEGKKRQITVTTMGYTGWKLVGVVLEEDLVWDTMPFTVFLVSLFLFFAILVLFLNIRISKYISNPIKELDGAVKEFEKTGEFVELDDTYGCYEVNHLTKSINSMVSTMGHLMEDIIEQERQKRKIEFDILQSQISPHFIYNSLDSAIWMIEAGKYQEAIVMVSSLARLFRISLSKGSNHIPVEDEISHAEHYMIIQKMRYSNNFETEIVQEDNVKNIFVLKLSIQPIVENAIYHGMASADGDGFIRVHLYLDEGDLVIDVTDNGLGMPPELVAILLEEGKNLSKTSSGIGLKNVHNRIQLSFGTRYGLEIFSELDEGTTVRMRLPILGQGDTDEKF